MKYVYYGNELYHHGILGQKWGVRRYQNEDGTLTAEGRNRYGKASSETKSEETKKGLSDKQKTALAAIGVYSLYKSGKLDGLISSGKKKYIKVGDETSIADLSKELISDVTESPVEKVSTVVKSSAEKVSESFKENVSKSTEGHYGVKGAIADYIVMDSSGEKADSALEYAKEHLDIMEPFDGRNTFLPEDRWDQNYFNAQKVELLVNFCEERYEHLKQVKQYLD